MAISVHFQAAFPNLTSLNLPTHLDRHRPFDTVEQRALMSHGSEMATNIDLIKYFIFIAAILSILQKYNIIYDIKITKCFKPTLRN